MRSGYIVYEAWEACFGNNFYCIRRMLGATIALSIGILGDPLALLGVISVVAIAKL